MLQNDVPRNATKEYQHVQVLVHMTGLHQTREQYFQSIKNGQLNYFSEVTDNLDITINGDNAKVIGHSQVEAAVFGGKNMWRLEQALKAVRKNGKWLFTESIASTY